jgi:hypothetical protein
MHLAPMVAWQRGSEHAPCAVGGVEKQYGFGSYRLVRLVAGMLREVFYFLFLKTGP